MPRKRESAVIHKNGNKIFFDDNLSAWRYMDNGEAAFNPRPCPRCHQFQDDEGIDACLQKMPGVKAACCGHGITKGFIEFEDGKRVEGHFSKERSVL